MLLELMSNGTLAELPPENIPDNIADKKFSVMLLLPHNKYLLGTEPGRWVYSDLDGTQSQNVFLYDGEGLSLFNDGTPPTIISPVTVNALQKELLQLTEPPGRHASTVLMLKTFMQNHPAFSMNDNAEFLDEKIFTGFMKKDINLFKAYWALRFGLSRGENETVARLKAWLKAEPENFSQEKNIMRMWFTIQDMPGEEIISELEELSFSKLELQRMAAQKISPVVLYNPVSGWLVLGKFGREGRKNNMIFIAWVFFSHELWHELREKKRMTVHDIILAAWGEHDTQQAMNERAKYKGAEIPE